jgi:hypothetical protein
VEIPTEIYQTEVQFISKKYSLEENNPFETKKDNLNFSSKFSGTMLM